MSAVIYTVLSILCYLYCVIYTVLSILCYLYCVIYTVLSILWTFRFTCIPVLVLWNRMVYVAPKGLLSTCSGTVTSKYNGYYDVHACIPLPGR